MNRISETSQRPYEVSVIVPFLNERDNVLRLYSDIKSALEPTGITFEIIFVDDGSSDDGCELVESLVRSDERVRLVQFTRNFGQTAAMSAGFSAASGKVYVAIDADNQNDPMDIPKLLSRLDEGFDVVSGWRKDRKDKLFSRRLPSVLANFLLARATGVKLHDFGCSLKAYRAPYIDSIELYGEMHRFIPALAGVAGAKVTEIPVNHRPRTAGKSKYGLIRTFKVLIDLVTVKFMSSFISKPSYLFGGLGLSLCIAGTLSAAEVIVEKFSIGTYAHKNPFLTLAIFLFSLGVQFFLMGLIAELLVRTYHESQNKKPYLVKKTVNLSPAKKHTGN